MNKQWKPGRQTVALQPSKIRRDPVQLASKVQSRTREQEMWLGAAGIVVTAAATAALIVGISNALRSSGANNQAAPPKFDYCYNGGPDCVLDGDTARIDRQWVNVAGMDVPQIGSAACGEEKQRGIAAAVRLRELLNSGDITLGAAKQRLDGRIVREVQVDGKDVAQTMIRANLARREGGGSDGWCHPNLG